MSVLGPGSLPALGLASAAAAANQKRVPELSDRDKADQALQKLQADEARLANRDLDDSIETDFSHGQVSDRDSDGRLPWQRPDGSTAGEEDPEKKVEKSSVSDPQGECCRTLDLQA